MIKIEYCPHCRCVRQMVQTYFKEDDISVVQYHCQQCKGFVRTKYTPVKKEKEMATYNVKIIETIEATVEAVDEDDAIAHARDMNPSTTTEYEVQEISS